MLLVSIAAQHKLAGPTHCLYWCCLSLNHHLL